MTQPKSFPDVSLSVLFPTTQPEVETIESIGRFEQSLGDRRSLAESACASFPLLVNYLGGVGYRIYEKRTAREKLLSQLLLENENPFHSLTVEPSSFAVPAFLRSPAADPAERIGIWLPLPVRTVKIWESVYDAERISPSGEIKVSRLPFTIGDVAAGLTRIGVQAYRSDDLKNARLKRFSEPPSTLPLPRSKRVSHRLRRMSRVRPVE